MNEVTEVTDETPSTIPVRDGETTSDGLREAWRQTLVEDIVRLVASFDSEPSRYLKSIVELLKVRENSTTEVGQLIEHCIREIFTGRGTGLVTKNDSNREKPCRQKTERCRVKDRRINIKQRRLNPTRVARRNAYRRVQEL